MGGLKRMENFRKDTPKERCRHGIIKLWCGICQHYQPTVTRKKTTMVKKVEWRKQSEKYAGILNQPYNLCGVRQCADNYKDERCPQPVYDEDETLCYYHQKIEDQKIRLKSIDIWNTGIMGGLKNGKKNEQNRKRMHEQTKRSYRDRKLRHWTYQGRSHRTHQICR